LGDVEAVVEVGVENLVWVVKVMMLRGFVVVVESGWESDEMRVRLSSSVLALAFDFGVEMRLGIFA
jgi:hypothetical protein